MKLLPKKIADYWHPEVIPAIPFMVWFIWRVETIVHLLSIIASK
jgi:hypothetical protein